ncbi:MAG: metal ABC transporter solute-binding protein, Zn/Mn family [Deferribacterales bacterium]
MFIRIIILLSLFFYSFSAYAQKAVTVSTTQIYDITKNIAGDDVRVSSILAPGQDPHTYTPVPADMDKVKSSDLLIENGFHLEGKNWMRSLAIDAKKPIITATDGIQPLTLETGGEKIKDPHSWFTPANAAVYVNNITRALIKLSPEHKDNFIMRAKLYLAQLRALDSWIRKEVSVIPPARRILVTNHDAFGYFAHEYGFVNTAPVGWSTGGEVGGGVTPQRREAAVNSIRQHNVKTIFVESTINPKLIREIAKDAGVTVGGTLYSDSMGDAGTPGETYIGMMRENVLKIVRGLR